MNDELKVEVYVEQPQGYEIKGEEKRVYKLKNTLYELKQKPRVWYTHINTYFMKISFKDVLMNTYNMSNLICRVDILIVCLYVDDLIITSNNLKMIAKFKEVMHD